jgi:hypothetical protein
MGVSVFNGFSDTCRELGSCERSHPPPNPQPTRQRQSSAEPEGHSKSAGPRALSSGQPVRRDRDQCRSHTAPVRASSRFERSSPSAVPAGSPWIADGLPPDRLHRLKCAQHGLPTTGEIRVVGCSVLLNSGAAPPVDWTTFPGSTNRSPTRPLIGAAIWQKPTSTWSYCTGP